MLIPVVKKNHYISLLRYIWPEHNSIVFGRYVDRHLITGSKNILELCPDQAHLMMVQYADESIALWFTVASTFVQKAQDSLLK